MSTAKTGTSFTTGPWAQTKHVLNCGRVITRASHVNRPYGGATDPERCRDTYMQSIAYVSQHPCHLAGGVEEAEANARLIAAAPDLYEASKALVASTYAPDGMRLAPARSDVDAIEAAIAKAEGRDQ